LEAEDEAALNSALMNQFDTGADLARLKKNILRRIDLGRGKKAGEVVEESERPAEAESKEKPSSQRAIGDQFLGALQQFDSEKLQQFRKSIDAVLSGRPGYAPPAAPLRPNLPDYFRMSVNDSTRLDKPRSRN